jgi:hypothetical protein
MLPTNAIALLLTLVPKSSSPLLLSECPTIPSSITTKALINNYEAKLVCHEPPTKTVPGEFTVYLAPGYSLQQHSEAIKTDLTPYIRGDFNELFKGQVVYIAEGMDCRLLKAIRADRGVEFVECNYMYYGDGEL